MGDIPQLGFGTYRLNDNTYESVKFALQNGYTHIDTAPLYKNEEQVGRAIKDSGIDRKNIFVTTKISRKELKSNKIQESIEESFKKLGLDYIDLILLHEPIDYEKNWDLLEKYYSTIGKNKVINIGVSNYNENHLHQIISKKKPFCNQIEINPFLLRNNIVNFCNNNDIKIVAHSPLAKGEKMNDNQLMNVSINNKITPAQTMLLWNLQQNHVIIPRSKNNNHIIENIVTNKEILSQDDLNLINTFDCQYATHPKYL